MKSIRVNLDGLTPRAYCRSCGQQIWWAVVTQSGRRMPFDGEPPSQVFADDDGTMVVDLEETPSHFATCPDAQRWRQRRQSAPSPKKGRNDAGTQR